MNKIEGQMWKYIKNINIKDGTDIYAYISFQQYKYLFI